MRILVTGGAGFIGSNLVDTLLKEGHRVISVDNFDPFYPKEIKLQNIGKHLKNERFTFIDLDVRDINQRKLPHSVDCVVHLAAKAGVRPSIENPSAYFDNNIGGTIELLNFCKKNEIKQFVFASSSSVYGLSPNTPWKETEPNLEPISPYAASKLACEHIGFTYSHLFDIRFLALRFFTVYGPRQRPDLAIHKFMRKIANKEALDLFGDGSTSRDYTYIDDIIQGINSAIMYNKSAYEIFNLGNSARVSLTKLVEAIGKEVGVAPIINYHDEQPGDVPHTCADVSKSKDQLGYSPKTKLEDGLGKQLKWLTEATNDTTHNA